MLNIQEILKNATPEQLQKATACKTTEEFLAFLKAEKIEITPEQAEKLFKIPTPPSGELSDEDLDAVSGGEIENSHREYMCPACYSTDLVFFPGGVSCRCLSCGKRTSENELVIKVSQTVYRCPKCKSHHLLPLGMLITCLDCGTKFEY